MSEEEIIYKMKSIANSLYLQGFIKDNDGEISKCLNNFLYLYNKEKEKNLYKDNIIKNLGLNYISKNKIRELKQKLSILADKEYNKYKKSTSTFVIICALCADIDDLLEE